jgi:hypothetical protein
MAIEEFVDSGLVDRARDGDRGAVIFLCKLAADNLQRDGVLSYSPEVVELFAAVLARIGSDGASPDEAFGWSRSNHRPKDRHLELRDYALKLAVRQVMRQRVGWDEACRRVSTDCSDDGVGGGFGLTYSTISKKCGGITEDSEIPLPDVLPHDVRR